MGEYKEYHVEVPHFYCIEYYEGDKKMIVEMDFREKFFELNPKLITHWEKPYDNIEIDMAEKKRIILNIKEFLLTRTGPENIFIEDL